MPNREPPKAKEGAMPKDEKRKPVSVKKTERDEGPDERRGEGRGETAGIPREATPDEIYEMVKVLCEPKKKVSVESGEPESPFCDEEAIIDHVMKMVTAPPSGGIVRPRPTPHPPKKKDGGGKKGEDVG